MITTKLLKTIEDFEAVKKGEFLAVEWYLNSYIGNERTVFAVYRVCDNYWTNGKKQREIILQKKNNVYFNFGLFCGVEEGSSNAKNVMLISQGHES